MKEYNGLNVVKFIMAFAVVAIHVRSSIFHGDAFGLYTNWFIRLAVPFFFISSGYLTKRKIDDIQLYGNNRISHYLSSKSTKFLKIFIYWLLIYFPFSLIHYIQASIPFPSCVKDYIFSIVIRGETFLAWPLWYVYSSAICFFLLSKINITKNQVLFWLLLVGLLFLFIADCLDSKPTLRYSYIISGLSGRGFGGLAYIALGMFLRSYLDKLKHPIFFSLILIILSFLLFDNTIFIFALLGGLGLTIAALMFTPPYLRICQIIKGLSMWVFFVHMIFVGSIVLFFPQMSEYLSPTSLFLVISFFSLLLSVAAIYLSDLPAFKFLKSLIGK